MTTTEKQFCEELQELLDRYKAKMEVPTIMRNAQKIFRNTLSIKTHPELHPYAKSELDYLEEFITNGPRVKFMHEWLDEAKDMKRNGELNERL